MTFRLQTAFLFLFLLFFFATYTVNAQDKSAISSPNSVYVEGLGHGLLYSINYDYRFNRHDGIRAGFTSWKLKMPLLWEEIDLKFTAFPVTYNYLAGEGSRHLELGIGLMPVFMDFKGEELFLGTTYEGTSNTVIGIATIGYRSQPSEGGFVFRIGLTPFFTFNAIAMSAGISLGYAF